MKIVGLISDTHIPSRARATPPKVFEVFHEATLIVHAGDFTQFGVLKELERLAPMWLSAETWTSYMCNKNCQR